MEQKQAALLATAGDQTLIGNEQRACRADINVQLLEVLLVAWRKVILHHEFVVFQFELDEAVSIALSAAIHIECSVACHHIDVSICIGGGPLASHPNAT